MLARLPPRSICLLLLWCALSSGCAKGVVEGGDNCVPACESNSICVAGECQLLCNSDGDCFPSQICVNGSCAVRQECIDAPDDPSCQGDCTNNCNGALAETDRCADFDSMYVGGVVGCTEDCQPDFRPCCEADCFGFLAATTACAELRPDLFVDGNAACSEACAVDYGSCVACGDDCGGELAASTDCSTLAPTLYSAGTATCTRDCRVDFGPCVAIDCGDDCGGRLTATDSCAELRGDIYLSGVVTCSAECTLDYTACVPRLGEFSPCSGSGQSTCEAGLTCRPVALLGPASAAAPTLCVTECGPGCVAGRTCVQTLGGDGVCMTVDAERDQPCLTNGRECAGGLSYECSPIAPDDFRCKLRCPSRSVGSGQSTCPASEACSASPIWESTNACVPSEIPSSCDWSERFLCRAVEQGGRCARPLGWCGDTIPLLAAFDGPSVTDHIIDPNNDCSLVDGHRYCGTTEALPDPAFFLCASIPYGSGDAHFCIAFCENPTGGPDLDCPSGLQCARSEPALFYEVQLVGGSPLVCAQVGEPDNCDVSEAYSCHSLNGGVYCARPKKLCTAP